MIGALGGIRELTKDAFNKVPEPSTSEPTETVQHASMEQVEILQRELAKQVAQTSSEPV